MQPDAHVPLALALGLLALVVPAAEATVDGPVGRLGTVGARPDVLARPDGSAVAAWEEKPTASTARVHVCRIAVGAAACAPGSEVILTGAAGTGTSRPFLLAGGAGRITLVQGGCCPQHTYRWISTDGGATFGTASDFASLVPSDQGAAAGPGSAISLLGAPSAGMVGYQLADPAAGKTTQTAALGTASGLAGAAVSVDPATARPFAVWGTATDSSFSGATVANAGLTASWTTPPGGLPGATGVRLAGPLVTWVRAGRRELARWTGSGFTNATGLPFTAPDAGEADIAVDPTGGGHVVFSPAGSGLVCYAHAADGTTFGAPRLMGADSEGVSDLQIAAAGPGAARVVFGATAPGGPVSTLVVGGPGLEPNTCGLAPAGLALAARVTGPGVNVAVDPSGQDTTMHVEYGTTTDYGTSTPDRTVPAAGGPAAFVVNLGELTPGTTYHARVVATNASGTGTGPDAVFAVRPVLRPVRARDVIRLPARCGRRLRVGFPARSGITAVRAVIRISGRRSLRLRAARLAAHRVLVSSPARRRVRVSVALRLVDGRILRLKKRYAACGTAARGAATSAPLAR